MGAMNLTNGRSAPLDHKEMRKLRGGLSLMLISMAIPFLSLINVRFILAGGFVSPQASEGLGAAAVIIMVLSGLFTLPLMNAAKAGDKAKTQQYVNLTMLFGLVAFVLIGVQVVNSTVSPVEHFGEIFLTALGTVDFYLLGGLIAWLSVSMRVSRQGLESNYWGAESISLTWRFMVLSWLVMYAVFYLI